VSYFSAKRGELFAEMLQDYPTEERLQLVAYPGILFGRGSKNLIEGRGQREQESKGGSPLVRGSAQF
jgi:hypothetical protein